MQHTLFIYHNGIFPTELDVCFGIAKQSGIWLNLNGFEGIWLELQVYSRQENQSCESTARRYERRSEKKREGE